MSDIKQVQDERLRELLERSRALMRDRQPTAAVRASVEAFMRLAELRPEELAPLAAAVRDAPQTIHWPDYGTRLVADAEGGDLPKVVFERERFSTSEAITYLEFVATRAIALGA